MNMKILKCCHCKECFPEENFYRDKSRSSGRKPRCKKCEKEYLDKEHRKEYEKKYRLIKPEKRREIMRRWYENNKEHYMQTLNKYRQTDNFKNNHRNHSAIRRIRMKSNIFEKIDFIKLYNEHPFCFYCNSPLTFQEVEFDHFYPISKGGSHTTENIRVACSTCNRRKGAMIYQVV